MINRYEQMKIKVVKNYCSKYNNSYAEFENGDTWKVVKANDSARGQRCNIAYIERSIDYDTYRCIIAPKMFDSPYTAIHLWGEGDLHISDTPALPF